MNYQNIKEYLFKLKRSSKNCFHIIEFRSPNIVLSILKFTSLVSFRENFVQKEKKGKFIKINMLFDVSSSIYIKSKPLKNFQLNLLWTLSTCYCLPEVMNNYSCNSNFKARLVLLPDKFLSICSNNWHSLEILPLIHKFLD